VGLVHHEQPDAAALIAAAKPGAENRSGATYSTRTSPRTAAAMVSSFAEASCWALTSPTRPGARSRRTCTWSCMSDTSGETTSVRSSRTSAGSW